MQLRTLAKRQKSRAYRQDMRLKGFATLGLIKGHRWAGPRSEGLHLTLVKWETFDPRRPSTRRLVAIPASSFGQGLDEPQFRDLLDRRGLGPAGFVELIQHLTRSDPQTAEQRVFAALLPPVENANEDRQRPQPAELNLAPRNPMIAHCLKRIGASGPKV